jgi:hypothetical protein
MKHRAHLALLLAFSLSALQLFSLFSRAATITVPAGANESAIQSAITGAAAGDTIQFTAGATYTFTQPLTLKDNITLDGNGCIWDATAQPDLIPLVSVAALQNVTFKNATARNIMFSFWVPSDASADITNINNIDIIAIRFQDGKALPGGYTQIDAHYIQAKAANINIVGCQFLRTSATPGRGVYFYSTLNATLTGCLFGATRADGADCDTHGWFKTALNVTNNATFNNPPRNTVITANKIYRTTAMDEAVENCDHGIYARQYDGLEISGNTISGWPAADTGGAIKLRNAQNFKVCNNLFIRSGILLYTYADPHSQYLKNGLITGNTIKIDPGPHPAQMYYGIGYYRNTGVVGDASEYSIRIVGNTLENGDIHLSTNPLNVAGWNADNGGVFDNTIIGGEIRLVAGITQSGNTILPAPASGAPVATLLTTLPAPIPSALQPSTISALQPATISALQPFSPSALSLPAGTTYDALNDRTYTANAAASTIDELNLDTGIATPQAGAPNTPGDNDGAARAARFNAPRDLAADTQGNLYIADTGNHTIRRLDTRTGQVTTLAGRPGIPGHADGPGSAATLTAPDTIQITEDGDIYIADTAGATLRHLQVAPIITKRPADTTAATGATITLTAEVTAAPYPTYQWHRNGAPIATATAATLTLAGLTPADTGAYTVTAQNPLGSATSAPAQLTIAAPEPPPSSPAPASNTSGGGGGAPGIPYLIALAALLLIARRHARAGRNSATP